MKQEAPSKTHKYSVSQFCNLCLLIIVLVLLHPSQVRRDKPYEKLKSSLADLEIMGTQLWFHFEEVHAG